MRYLDILKNKVNLSEEDFESLKDDVKVVFERLEEKNVKFGDENFEISFYNHIASLTKRIKAKELVDPLPEEFMGETTDEAKELSTYLVGHIFDKYGMDRDITEIFLVSTHIQLTLGQ